MFHFGNAEKSFHTWSTKHLLAVLALPLLAAATVDLAWFLIEEGQVLVLGCGMAKLFGRQFLNGSPCMAQSSTWRRLCRIAVEDPLSFPLDKCAGARCHSSRGAHCKCTSCSLSHNPKSGISHHYMFGLCTNWQCTLSCSRLPAGTCQAPTPQMMPVTRLPMIFHSQPRNVAQHLHWTGPPPETEVPSTNGPNHLHPFWTTDSMRNLPAWSRK